MSAPIHYFIKEIVSRPILIGGRPVEFTEFGRGTGGIATNDPAIVKGLQALVAKGQGGVIEVQKSDYEEIKKKLGTLKPRVPSVHVEPRLQGFTGQRKSPAPAAAAVKDAAPSEPAKLLPDGTGIKVPANRIPLAKPAPVDSNLP